MAFGLDIGSFSLKVIQCQKKDNKFYLQHWGEVKTPAPVDEMEKKARITLGETIKRLISDAKINSQEVMVALSESKVFSRVIQLPVLSESELASAIQFEAEQYIPLPLDQVEIEYLILSEPPKNEPGARMDILLIAAQKTAIDNLLNILDSIGLIPKAMETEILAINRCLSVYPDVSLIINIGKDSSSLAIIKGQNLKFVYTFPTGGDALTRSIAQVLSLDINQAEEYKRAYGLEENVLEGKVAKAMLPSFNMIVQQIQKTINFYFQKTKGVEAIKRLILTGGTAEMPGLAQYLTKVLGIETVLGDPFINFVKDKNFPQHLIKVGARFSTAVGLAIRDLK